MRPLVFLLVVDAAWAQLDPTVSPTSSPTVGPTSSPTTSEPTYAPVPANPLTGCIVDMLIKIQNTNVFNGNTMQGISNSERLFNYDGTRWAYTDSDNTEHVLIISEYAHPSGRDYRIAMPLKADDGQDYTIIFESIYRINSY